MAEARTHTNLSQAEKFPLVVKRRGVGELHTGAGGRGAAHRSTTSVGLTAHDANKAVFQIVPFLLQQS